MNIIYTLAFLLFFQFQFAFDQGLESQRSSDLPGSQQEQKSDKAGAANIVFKSTDGGQTWQDISEGLPEPVQDNYGIGRNVFFADDNGLYLTAGKWDISQ
ncbi:MAG: glycosyl hydrolase [Segetibacter sp.]|nr:glycosyl hydrolase [Segetibacter sp.]